MALVRKRHAFAPRAGCVLTDDNREFPLPKVKSDVLRNVLHFLQLNEATPLEEIPTVRRTARRASRTRDLTRGAFVS